MRFITRAIYRLVVLAAILNGLSARAAQIEIVPIETYSAEQLETLKRLALDSISARHAIKGHRFRILESRQASSDPEKERAETAIDALSPGDVQFLGYDYDADRLIQITVGQIEIATSSQDAATTERTPPFPSPEEYAEAEALLKADPTFGPLAAYWRSYEAMPGIIDPEELGLQDTGRIFPIGIMPEPGAPRELVHEIVAVNLSSRTIIRFPELAPPSARAPRAACAPRNAGQANNPRGLTGTAQIRMKDDAGTELWSFTAVRPANSSGKFGSGIDLRNISYRGRKYISQLHTPVLNVQYARNVCGPYRDWQYSENPFQASGTPISPGFLQATGHPTTILESMRDAGNYRGVAVSTEGQGAESILRLVSEVSAGWYRYQTEYLFHADGRIEPRWGFAAIQDSCTCNLHFHNAYWRIDFDLGHNSPVAGANTGDRAEVGDGKTWRLLSTESKLLRTNTEFLTRVSNTQSGLQATLFPGERDGTADAFGKADAWLLKFHPNQLDDSAFTRRAAIAIDSFVNQEVTIDTDLVVWYGAHFRHDTDDDSESSHILGPTIQLRENEKPPVF